MPPTSAKSLRLNTKSGIQIIVLICVISLPGCQTEDLKSAEGMLSLPNWPHDYSIGNNDNVTTLGRVLFYDTRLSANSSVSCASCHKQELAFSDNQSLSVGFENKLTSRNAIAIQNIVGEVDTTNLWGWNASNLTSAELANRLPSALFWDGRQTSLPAMVLEPIQNHIEMGSDLNVLSSRLSEFEEYQSLFSKAFPDTPISPTEIAVALSAFIVNIRSERTKFDGQWEFTNNELRGQSLFFDTYDCNSCHQLQQLSNGYQLAGGGQFGGFVDSGLDEVPPDEGLFRVTGNQTDKGKFKVPSLRNVGITAPYMHDGRFETLEEVLDQYSNGIKQSDNLDTRLRAADGSAAKFNIPSSDKQAIIAFLQTLTDHSMISDPWLSNPFRIK